MGLSFDFLVYSKGGTLDLRRAGTVEDAGEIVRRLYPRTAYAHVETRRLLDACRQPRGRLAVGAFEEGALIATKDAHLYDPDILDRRYRKLVEWPDLQVLTSESVSDMFAYARWRAGVLTRCISVNPVGGIWRDQGHPEAFEGEQPATPDRWLDLSNGALAAALRLEGDVGPAVPGAVAWDEVELHVYAR